MSGGFQDIGLRIMILVLVSLGIVTVAYIFTNMDAQTYAQIVTVIIGIITALYTSYEAGKQQGMAIARKVGGNGQV